MPLVTPLKVLLCLAASVLLAAPPFYARAAEALPDYNVDANQSSVSGLSSGAFMAVQFHLAFSDTLVGAGVVAGGPYYCAENNLPKALNRCMKTLFGAPNPSRLFAIARHLANEGKIASLSNLANHKVYIFSGTRDATVRQRVVYKTLEFYRLAGVPDGNIQYVDQIAAGHAMITDDYGASCSTTASPYINDCDYDQAGAILKQIYGSLNAPAETLTGRFLEFDQSAFIANPATHSMGDVGYAYVPSSCGAGRPCKVHVAFHGCQQSNGQIGDKFSTQAGYNEWADTNDIIVLYPQAHAGPGNPKACWDWWGYDSPDYHVKTGRQMAAVKRMLDRLAGKVQPDDNADRYCESYAGNNFSHWLEGRAHFCNFWFICAKGSDENLGFLVSSPTLYEHPKGIFSSEVCGD